MQRRTLIKAAGLGLIAVAGAGGATLWLTPREAKEQGAPHKVLTAGEVETLEALGEVMLPGARADGIANFVDSQLAAAPADCLLILRYFDWPPPYAAFYKASLAALDGAAKTQFGKAYATLPPEQADALAGQLLGGQVSGWQGPPPPLFYMAARSDAVDVVYGTVEGFKKLGIPYMAHILPETRW
jgi:hypothetical protein